MLGLSDIVLGEIQIVNLNAPAAAVQAILTELIDTGNAYDAVKVGLFTGAGIPGDTTTLADLVARAPVFTGYALSSVVVWGAAHSIGDRKNIVVGDTKQFVAGADPLTPQTVTGFFIQSAAGLGPILLHSGMLPTPFVFREDGDVLPIVPILAIRGAA